MEMVDVETKNFIGEAEKEEDAVIGEERVPIYRFRVFPKDWESVMDDGRMKFRSRRYEKEWFRAADKLLNELERQSESFIAFINSNFDGVPPRPYFSVEEGNPLGGIIEVWDEEGFWETYICSPKLIVNYIKDEELHEEVQRWALDTFLYLVGAGKYYGSWECGHVETGRLMAYVGYFGSNLPYCKQLDGKYCGTYGEFLIRLKKDVEDVGFEDEVFWLCYSCRDSLYEEDYEVLREVYEELIE